MHKNWLLIISTIILTCNIGTIFAQTLEIEVLGGGYKLRGPVTIEFSEVSTSFSNTDSEVDFRNLTVDPYGNDVDTTGSITIIDENGGNPFDVTVSATQLARDEGGGNLANCISTPEKCIPTNKYFIRNQDTNGATPNITTIHGSSADLSLNSDTDSYSSFASETLTTSGSSGTNLNVANTHCFQIGDTLTIGGATPSSATVFAIPSSTSITLNTSLTTPPGAGETVTSNNICTHTLSNGTGIAPGQWKIFPNLKITVPAGQTPGSYISTLSFTIA